MLNKRSITVDNLDWGLNTMNYKVGDIIAYRVTDVSGRTTKAGECYKNPYGEILESSSGCAISAAILERLPAGSVTTFPHGWTWKQKKESDSMPDGAVILIGACGLKHSGWCKSGEVKRASDSLVFSEERIVLVPPKPSPCPELAAKIKRLEDEIAALKNEALG